MKTSAIARIPQKQTKATKPLIQTSFSIAFVASCSNPSPVAADISPLKLPDATRADSRRLLRSGRPNQFECPAHFAVRNLTPSLCVLRSFLLSTFCFLLCLAAGFTATAQTFTTIKTFGVPTYVEGANPYAGLAISGNTLYGTTEYGGSGDHGTVFKVNTDGTGYVVLKSFLYSDGWSPRAGVTLSGNTLYGTTYYRETAPRVGSVFKVNTDGTGYTVLRSFTGDDGWRPAADLTLSGGTLYGTTSSGGSGGGGTVFKMNTNGTGFLVLRSFTNSPDAKNPYAGLTLSGNTLYGTTSSGGTSGNGTVFKVNTDGTGYAVLKSFTGTDGANPQAALTLSGGTLYGTTSGTVFKINTDGTGFMVLKSLAGSDGASPRSLVLSGRTLYGTTFSGGSSFAGTVFKINTDGTGFMVLKSFNSSEGANPNGGLVLSGTTLYGTTQYGGSAGDGTVFSLTVLPSQLPPQSLSGGNVALITSGFPDMRYALEWTHSLNPPVTWETLATNTADADGLVAFTNAPSPPGLDFYRTRYVPE